MHVALFSDSYDQPLELADWFSHVIDYCNHQNLKLDIYTAAPRDDIRQFGNVHLIQTVLKDGGHDYPQKIAQLQLTGDFLAQQLHSQRYQLVHAATPGPMAINGVIFARSQKIPILASHHANLPPSLTGQLQSLAQAVLPDSSASLVPELRLWHYIQWFYNQVDQVLVPNEMLRRQLAARLSVPVALLPAGVDCDRYHPNPRTSRSGPLQALYVGPVTREKNVNVLVELLKDRDDCRLLVIGQGAYLTPLRRLYPRAVIHESPDDAALPDLYASADFFLSASTSDGSSDTVLKALAAGLPVVLSNKSSLQELVQNGREGFVIANFGQLQQCVEQLIKDAALRQKLAAAARQTALQHAWPAVMQALFHYYRQRLS